MQALYQRKTRQTSHTCHTRHTNQTIALSTRKSTQLREHSIVISHNCAIHWLFITHLL